MKTPDEKSTLTEIEYAAEIKLNRTTFYKSQSIEEWRDEIYKTYQNGQKAPDHIIMVLKRNGECYEGGIYLTKEDMERRKK